MAVFFTSDLHLYHDNWIKTLNMSPEDHWDLIKTNWNKEITKRDKIYILGDITMENHKYYHLLDELRGMKVIIGGNHDLEKDMKYLLPHVEKVIGCLDYKGFICTHIPIHPLELNGRYRGNIHGHMHKEKINDYRYINVCTDFCHYQPLSFDYIEMLVNRDPLIINSKNEG